MKLIFENSKEVRLEKFMQAKLPFLRRAFVQKLFRKKEIKVAEKPQKADAKIPAHSKVEVFLPDPRKYFFELTGNRILFEDTNVVAFDKRAGIATHAGVGTRGDDLRNCAETLLQQKLIVVHRLDRATSGVVVFAKNAAAARKLEDEFRQRKVFKKYFAVVEGIPKKPNGEINLDLKKVGQKMEIVKKGLSAQTFWKVIQKHPSLRQPTEALAKVGKRGSSRACRGAGGFSLLEVEITTGRTHQIRVHLAAIGLPVVGDDLYGHAKDSRMLLHAAELKILDYTFEAKIPQAFKALESEVT